MSDNFETEVCNKLGVLEGKFDELAGAMTCALDSIIQIMNSLQQTATEQFSGWAIVELMGHNKISGRVTTTTLAGSPFIRVDVPAVAEQKAYTRFFNPSAVYSINPVTEEIATGMVADCRSEPVQRYQLPRLLTAPEEAPE